MSSDGRPAAGPLPVAVVIVTRNRRAELLRTLERLSALEERPELIVVDNASTDGSAEAVREHWPRARVLAAVTNLGASGRTMGVRVASAPVVAFADDDSWWAPGALRRAAEAFAGHPGVGLINGRILVGPEEVEDHACRKMRAAPLGHPEDLPGPLIMGHLGCGTIVRRRAYLGVGGYSPVLGFGAEERLLALDLAAAGWQQCYVGEVVAHHDPSPLREEHGRRRARYRRNDVLSDAMRMPPTRAAAALARFAADAGRERAARGEAMSLARRLPMALALRRAVPVGVVTALDRARRPRPD